MIELAAPKVVVKAEALDTDPWWLNVKNGTLNLRTGKLQDHRREDFLTRLAPVDFDQAAPASLWAAFLERVMPDQDERGYLQRAAGYSLTGSIREQVFFTGWGTGQNGKTTFIETVADVMGDYAQEATADLLLERRDDRIPNDVARLRGARFVSGGETPAGRRLNEALIKQLTGGDRMAARFLNKEFFDFIPACKLWVRTNHKPIIRGTDTGIWRRIRLIPWTEKIPDAEKDVDLGQKLRTEASGRLPRNT